MEITKKRKAARPAPLPADARGKDKEKGNTRITWARNLTDQEIVGLLQMKLLESRARRGTRVGLLNELVHEIKHRLDRGPRREPKE